MRRWFALLATVLAITMPAYAFGADISDEDDCTMVVAARCTRG